MSGFSTSALLAVVLGLVALPVLFIPYAVWSFRTRRGGPGRALITAGGVLYVMALWTYTILPLPQIDELVCDGSVRAQLVPFQFLREIDTGSGVGGVLRDPALRQVVLNVIFFVPLGILVRHLMQWRAWACVAAGFGVSLFIELTQLTGDWFIYPCAYRLFDVDDLLANTLGAAIGVALAPLARLVPGQYVNASNAPQPVQPWRRIRSMLVDGLCLLFVGSGVPLGVRFALYLAGQDHERHADTLLVLAWAGAALTFLVIVPAASGATLGQHLSNLRPVRPDGTPVRWYQWVVRGLAGGGVYAVLHVFGDLRLGDLGQLIWAWVALCVAVVAFINTRGVSGYASGLIVVDAREPDLKTALSTRGADPRRLSAAVFVVGAVVYLAVSALVAVAAISPAVGAGISAVVAVVLVVSNVALLGYLLHTGITVVRREGRSLGNLLNLVAVLGVLLLIVLLGLALAFSWAWLLIPTVAGLALTAHFGLMLAAFVVYGAVYARQSPRRDGDAIVVLGSRVYGNRVPPLLAARIDKGLELLDAELEHGRRPLLILSGGQGPDEEAPEGEVMADYARDAGAPDDVVRAETRARTTEENLLHSRDLLLAEGRGTDLVVTTNDYHAFRAAIIARELGLDAQVVGAPTARYFFPSAVLREFVAVLSRTPVLHAAVGLAVLVGSGLLTWLMVRG